MCVCVCVCCVCVGGLGGGVWEDGERERNK